MNNAQVYQRVTALINKFTSFSICIPTSPSHDSVAAAIVLYLALIKLGKNATIACAADITQQFNISGVDKIQKNLASGGDNLVITFPYSDGSIDKVTYNIEGNNFNLVIQPCEGRDKLDPSQVRYSYSGGKVDVIIVVDAPTLNSLGELYIANQDQFKGRDIINIDRHLTNANFGTINIVEKKISSNCEIVLRLISYLNIQIDRDMATNLYSGIAAATNNFTAYSVTPETFEALAYLLKAGAVKRSALRSFATHMSSIQQPVGQPTMPTYSRSMSNQLPPTYQQPQNYDPDTEFADDFGYEESTALPTTPLTHQLIPKESQGSQFQPSPMQMPQTIKSVTNVPVIEKKIDTSKKVEAKEQQVQAGIEEENPAKSAPKDWLKPKIFRGSNLV